MDGMVALCLEARGESSVGPQVCTADPVTLGQQLGALTAAPGGTVLVAVTDTEIVGILLGRVMGPNPFTAETSLAVEVLFVAPRHRRRGVGHALMVRATELAAAAGADHVYAAPIPGARGMQRFFVQLGFAPAATHRVTTTLALQRRLAQDGATARRSSHRSLEDLIARRRQSRGDTPTGEIEAVRPVRETDQSGRRAAITRHVRRAVQTRLEVESSTTIS
ncbi:MAG: GCN5-related N-acetyltransferase [Actinotalea sp.]|nr:GCN5-related N-acetyltransferase [Actinotalea sp.]